MNIFENPCSTSATTDKDLEQVLIDRVGDMSPAIVNPQLPAIVGQNTTAVIDNCVDQMVTVLQNKCDAMQSDELINQQDMIEVQQLVRRCNNAIVLITYYIGRMLLIIRQKRLYLVLGYDSYASYTEAVLDIKRSQASKYTRIARELSQELASQLGAVGIENAYRLMTADIEAITDFVCTHDLEHMTARQATPIVTQYLADRAKNAEARYASEIRRAQVTSDALQNQLDINTQIRRQNKKKKKENDCLRSEHHLPVRIPLDIPDNPVLHEIKPNSVRYVGKKTVETIPDIDKEIIEPTMSPAEDNSNITILLQQLEALAQYVEHNLTNLQAMDDAAKNKARTILQGIIARLT